MEPSKLPDTPTSIFAVMSQLAAEENALNLSQGYPSFTIDPVLKELVQKAVQDDHNQYAPMPGLPGLRERIAEMTRHQHGANYDPENEITVTAGATQGIYAAITACVFPGDEVIIFTPAYDSYQGCVKINGGKVVELPMTLPDFTIDWQQAKEAVTDRTKMIVINSPHNPSGAMLTEGDMAQLQEIVMENDLYLLSDEVYEHMTYDGHEHLSVARYPELAGRSFITGSFGKTFHVTGWKTGFCLSPEKLTAELRKIHQQMVFCVNRPMQHALAEYLEKPERYTELGAFYQKKRDYFLERISDSRFDFTPSQGTYFQLLDYSRISDHGDVAFAKAITKEHKLAAIPISVFMSGTDPKMLRFCFAKEEEELDKAAQIINSL